MKRLLPLLMAAVPLATAAQSQSGGMPSVAMPQITDVLVIQTVRQVVTLQQVMGVMPAEIRATLKLYFEGKIRQWYSKGDGKGVVILLDVKTVEEARAIIDAMPLSKENL